MIDERRQLARWLYELSAVLPPAERQRFAAFLFSQPGAAAPKRKVHSWRKKRGKLPRAVAEKRPSAKPVRRSRNRQLELDLQPANAVGTNEKGARNGRLCKSPD